jgi:N-methylhydantoinase A/oxoprolinase/acetone carboxylase beta subunit
MAGFRVGVDIGRTFTDIVFLDADGGVHTRKVSSSVDDYARAGAGASLDRFGNIVMELRS